MDDATAAQIADEVFAAAPQIATVPGVAYGLVRDGELVHVHGRGAASIGGPVPDGDTVFRIASMTKSFTAATVLLLRDEGALRLDDPLTDVLPWAATIGAPDGPPITIRDLLTMGSGLATDDPWGDRQESLPAPEFDAMVAAGLSFCRPARMAFEYSNTGYALLGRVIEEITGMGYAEAVRARVLAPLGMTDTGYDPRVVPDGRRATGYRIASDGTPVAEPLVTPGAYSAMGGLLSTVRDLAAWVGGFQRSWRDGAPGHPVDRWSLREAQEMARYASTDAGVDSSAGDRRDGLRLRADGPGARCARPRRVPLRRLPGVRLAHAVAPGVGVGRHRARQRHVRADERAGHRGAGSTRAGVRRGPRRQAADRTVPVAADARRDGPGRGTAGRSRRHGDGRELVAEHGPRRSARRAHGGTRRRARRGRGVAAGAGERRASDAGEGRVERRG